MQYDPIKNLFASLIRNFPFLRKCFFHLLDMLFLRQWYVKKLIIDLFPRYLKLKFYDAGAGFCQYSDFILQNWKSSSVLALDLKEDYLKEYATYATKKYPSRFNWITDDLVSYIPQNKFNLIAAIDILEHIEDDLSVLKNFHHCLEEGGRLIISTPSDLDETARFTAEHVRPGYSENEIKSKLTNAGFLIKEFRYSYGKWGKLSWILSIKLTLKLLSYSKVLLLILPIYYLCLYPVIYLLMSLDVKTDNKSGNGIVVLAEKPLNAS